MTDLSGDQGTAPQTGLMDQAKSEFSILQDHDIGFKYSPGRGNGFLEFWPAGETGSPELQRPAEFDIGKPGVEVYHPNTRPIDILGDITSHHLIEADPKVKAIYADFIGSLEPWQHDNLAQQYQYAQQNFGESRPYEAWRERSGFPGYFRGYPFQQWEKPEEMYTPEQMKKLNGLMDYLRSGNRLERIYQQITKNKDLLGGTR